MFVFVWLILCSGHGTDLDRQALRTRGASTSCVCVVLPGGAPWFRTSAWLVGRGFPGGLPPARPFPSQGHLVTLPREGSRRSTKDRRPITVSASLCPELESDKHIVVLLSVSDWPFSLLVTLVSFHLHALKALQSPGRFIESRCSFVPRWLVTEKHTVVH